ncbi:MAG: prolyl oligopeptidase family serine peptidase [Ferruginibacter sp.]
MFKAACWRTTNRSHQYVHVYILEQRHPDQKYLKPTRAGLTAPDNDRLEEHKRNSPMFNATNIKSALLVAFGDKDGAVDWHQGIEMYGTIRRMQKPHVMLVYADENHGLAKKENQVDYQKRQKAMV